MGGTRSAGATTTLRDVAARAGVSTRTVSNVVTGNAPVREATRSRVETAISELGYRPNQAARRLRSGRASALGLVLPDVTVPYFREFADEVLTAAHGLGYGVVVVETHGEPARERTALEHPGLRHVDGVVFTAVGPGPGPEDPQRAYGRPVVLAGGSAFTGSLDAVGPVEQDAGRAVGDLLGRGPWRRPVLLSAEDPYALSGPSERLGGFLGALAEHGLDDAALTVVHAGAVTLAEGRARARDILARAPHTDVVFANADALALGLLRGLRDAGRSVPDDIAVVGFGDVELAAHSNPTLTTVDTERAAVARAAIGVIRDRLVNGLDQSRMHVDTGFRLVKRESTDVRR